MGRRIERKRPATYADVQAAPEHMVAELIDGTLYTSPRPAIPHARASSRLYDDLGGPFDRGRGGPGDRMRAEPFAAHEIELAALWRL